MRVEITPAKRRFGRTPRKQWQFLIIGDNNKPISEKDTYANVDDIIDALRKFKNEPVEVVIHYAKSVGRRQL